MARLSNPLKKLQRCSSTDSILAQPPFESICGCCLHIPTKPKNSQDGESVTTANTTLSGDTRSVRISRCEELGYIIGNAAVCLSDGFATVMKCCDGTFGKNSSDRSCCTTIRWGADEVRYIEEREPASNEAAEPTENGSRLVLMKGNNRIDPAESNEGGSMEWPDFGDQFKITSDDIVLNSHSPEGEVEDEANQCLVEVAFSADLPDFISFASSPDVPIDDCSVKSSNTNATGKNVRSCACCGKVNAKEAPVKLKICSRCKTTYYCSAECQKVDWHYGHKHKCKAQILL